MPVVHMSAKPSFVSAARIAVALVLVLACVGWAGSAAFAQGVQDLKIGVINLNRALNESAAGERSKKILLSAKSQKENELRAKEEELKKLREEMQGNIMLTKEARDRKEQDLRERERQLRREVQKAQQELQEQERKLTESIFVELRTVMETYAKDKGFDLILEENASQVILFHKVPFIDITDDVIERYNKLQQG